MTKKTWYTSIIESHKMAGKVEKVGKARFADGMTAMERVLWKVNTTGEEFVMLNGNALKFRRYKEEDGIVYGFI